MVFIFFLLSLLILWFLKTRTGFIDTMFIVPFVFFIYGFSFYIDNVLFGVDKLVLDGFDKLPIDNPYYLLVAFFYLLFFIGYTFFALLLKRNRYSRMQEIHYYKRNQFYSNLLILFFIGLQVFMGLKLMTMDRFDKIDTLSSNKLVSIMINVSIFGSIILVFKSKFQEKIDKLIPVFALSVLFYGAVEGGREIFIYIILVVIFYKDNVTIRIGHIALLLVVFGLISIWKPFSVFVIQYNDFSRFLLWMSRNYQFSLSGQDPITSNLLIVEYLKGNVFFEQYRLSYVSNTFMQLLRTFHLVSYDSIGESTVKHFNPSFAKRGGGLAFSGILESFLNFWYFGPVVLGIGLGYISSSIRRLRSTDKFKYKVYSVFFVILGLKLVRTELAVVLKIYLLPMVLAYFIFYRMTYSRKLVRRGYSNMAN